MIPFIKRDSDIRDRGQAIVEFALVAPVVLLIVVFMIDVGLLFYTNVSMTNAVREGARCAAVGGGNAAVEARVRDTAPGFSADITVDPPSRSGGVGGNVEVAATYTYDWITPVGLVPGINLTDLTFTRTADMRLETDGPYDKGCS